MNKIKQRIKEMDKILCDLYDYQFSNERLIKMVENELRIARSQDNKKIRKYDNTQTTDSQESNTQKHTQIAKRLNLLDTKTHPL